MVFRIELLLNDLWELENFKELKTQIVLKYKENILKKIRLRRYNFFSLFILYKNTFINIYNIYFIIILTNNYHQNLSIHQIFIY